MPDVVSLSIEGVEFEGWEALTITRSLDSLAHAFSLSGPFNPEDPAIIKAFRPFEYQKVLVTIDGEKLLTGRIESVAPSVTEADRVITIQGRSLTGPLLDCSVDIGKLQFDGLSLSTIARQVCNPHGIGIVALNDTAPILEARADPGQGGFDFLNKLAADASLLLTTDTEGRLVIFRYKAAGAPVASLAEGQGLVKAVTASYNGTGRWSRYKVLQQQDGAESITGTAEDKGVKIYRPIVEVGSEGDAKEIQKAAAWKRALALASSVSVSVTLAGWRAPAGMLWAPGQIVTLKAPGAFLTQEATMAVAEATLTLDASQGRISTLRLVLPATYSGEMPGSYPWA
jgi:prophage tail gpP-like protein